VHRAIKAFYSKIEGLKLTLRSDSKGFQDQQGAWGNNDKDHRSAFFAIVEDAVQAGKLSAAGLHA